MRRLFRCFSFSGFARLGIDFSLLDAPQNNTLLIALDKDAEAVATCAVGNKRSPRVGGEETRQRT